MSISLKYPPEAFDGKPLVTANALPEWCILNMTGAGDTESAIGGGNKFQMECDDPENDVELEFSFIDSVYVTSGMGVVKNAKLGDHIQFQVHADASTTEVNGGGTGNCNSVATGQGFDIIVPAPGNGYADIDLDTDANLVPAADDDGFWDWDYARTGRGVITPNYNQTGEYNLYNVTMNLAAFATKLPLLGDHVMSFGIPNVRAKLIPPHWHWHVYLHSGTTSNMTQVVFFLNLGRARSFLNPVVSE